MRPLLSALEGPLARIGRAHERGARSIPGISTAARRLGGLEPPGIALGAVRPGTQPEGDADGERDGALTDADADGLTDGDADPEAEADADGEADAEAEADADAEAEADGDPEAEADGDAETDGDAVGLGEGGGVGVPVIRPAVPPRSAYPKIATNAATAAIT